ncbi:MAG: CocE/NonD family hydrolase [Chlorobi bacterium]|nr:CocE/NonD family hydrolase [Chlorobiota bacterium]
MLRFVKSKPWFAAGTTISFIILAITLVAYTPAGSKELTIDNYQKFEYRIPMRDGVHLFTSVYIPKIKSRTWPIMLNRTPYSVRPYGKGKKSSLGPSEKFMKDGYIFVYQDVRGRFMSEGTYVNMRPIADHTKPGAVDESTDTWDTVDWLIKNLPGNNGKVGIWGISYPGFYASCAAIDAHPAVKAVSPQAPIADWFFDDFHHHGTLFLPHCFNFIAVFGQPRHGLTTQWGKRFSHGTPDGYRFFLEEVGPLTNVNKKYFHDSIAFWDSVIIHPDYDRFWTTRNLLPHLRNIKPAVLVVGGWYDAEDLYGTFNTYSTIEANNPGADNRMVIGPWRHGGWARSNGSHLGYVWFPTTPPPSVYYRENLEYPFFRHYLKGGPDPGLAEVTLYETGANKWRSFPSWPPAEATKKTLWFHSNGSLMFAPQKDSANNEFISDPAKPVPYSELITTGMSAQYMTDDQRFASRRPDVLVYQTEPLEKSVTLAGKLTADLFVSTTGTDADWIVKLIDVYPDTTTDFKGNPSYVKMGGYQQMVRSEVIRGRYRNSYSHPEPFVPNRITEVKFPLQDVLHTFNRGHRIMIQVQTTWFPLIDRNPQKFVKNIYEARPEDFIKATQRVYSGPENGSRIVVKILEE